MTNTTQPIFTVTSSEFSELPNDETLLHSIYSEGNNIARSLKSITKSLSQTKTGLKRSKEFGSLEYSSKIRKVITEDKVTTEKDQVTAKQPLKNGRWTKEECKRFEEALKKFGRHWKKVEAYVGTRSGTQVRSHAQKYFLRMKSKEKLMSAIQGADLSAGQATFVPATPEKSEKNEPDTIIIEEKKEVSSFTLERPQPRYESAFKPFKSQLSTLNLFEKRKMYVPTERKYLEEYIRRFGYQSARDIYLKLTRLSDWVKIE